MPLLPFSQLIYYTGLDAIREQIGDLPSFLNEYERTVYTVYGLCGLHAMRNAGSKTKFGYAAARNFCRAATESEHEAKKAVLKKHYSKDCYDYMCEHADEICWYLMNKKFGLRCTLGITNSNGSESTNNHCFELRGSLITEAIEESSRTQARMFSAKLALAHGYKSKGKSNYFDTILF